MIQSSASEYGKTEGTVYYQRSRNTVFIEITVNTNIIFLYRRGIDGF